MMIDLNVLLTDPKQFKRLTKVKPDDFKRLSQVFEIEWQAYFSMYTFSGSPRQRIRSVNHSRAVFKQPADALLFLLLYLYSHLRQEELAELFKLDQPKACKWCTLTKHLLQATLKNHPHVLPFKKRQQLTQSLQKEKVYR